MHMAREQSVKHKKKDIKADLFLGKSAKTYYNLCRREKYVSRLFCHPSYKEKIKQETELRLMGFYPRKTAAYCLSHVRLI